MGWQDLPPSKGWRDEWGVWHEPAKDLGNTTAHEPQKPKPKPENERQ